MRPSFPQSSTFISFRTRQWYESSMECGVPLVAGNYSTLSIRVTLNSNNTHDRTRYDYFCEAGFWCKVRTVPSETRNLLCPAGGPVVAGGAGGRPPELKWGISPTWPPPVLSWCTSPFGQPTIINSGYPGQKPSYCLVGLSYPLAFPNQLPSSNQHIDVET